MIEIGMISIALLVIYFFWYFQIYGNLLLALYGCSLIAYISICIDIASRREIIFKEYPFGIWVKLLMIPYCLLTAIFASQNKMAAISATITYSAFAMISFVIAYISMQKKSIDWLINTLCVIVLFDCVWVITRGVYFPGYGKVLGVNCNPNTLGVIMLLGIFSLAYKSRIDTHFSFLYMVLALLPLYIIIGCGSRKCFIAAIVLVGLWAIAMVLHILRNYKSLGAILFICIFLIIGYLGLRYFKQYYSNTDLSNRMLELGDVSENSRIAFYRKALDLFKENLLFGVGIDQFQYRSGTGNMSHSTYAEMIADFGLIGSSIYSLSFISAISLAIKGLFSSKKENLYCIVIIFALICVELFLGIGQVFFFDIEHFIAWTIIYVLLQINVIQKKELNDDKSVENYQFGFRSKYIRY